MSEAPYPTDFERMRGNIREQLGVETAIGDLPLDDGTLDRIAEGIATNLDHAFSIAWAPKWVKEREPHRWVEGTQHFVECTQCRRITVHGSIDEADAWWEEHTHAEHG